MNRTITPIMLIAMASLCEPVYGQLFDGTSVRVIPPAPEAAALFKSTEIPVSLTTGLPSITVPIYTVRLDGFELPITLKYNSSAIRVDELASSVGLGWTLEAGGMVSSAVHGMPDFDPVTGSMTVTPDYPENRALDPKVTLVSGQFVRNGDYEWSMAVTGNQAINSQAPPQPLLDTEPDIFYYSFGGRSGKFFFGRDRKPHPIPYEPIAIVKTGDVFTITDESGNRFIFDKQEFSTAYNSGFSNHIRFSAGSNTVTNISYYLGSIITPKGEQISFEYEPVSYSYQSPKSYTRYRPLSTNMGDFSVAAETSMETLNVVNGRRLKRITGSNGDLLVFHYSACPRLDLPANSSGLTGGFALKQIVIHGEGGNRQFDLTTGYFNISNYVECQSSVTDPNSVRLKLVSVKMSGESPYRFDYYGNNSLSNRLAEVADHWGYHSATGGRYFREPSRGFTSMVGDRLPDLTSTLRGTLRKITYPTGGTSVFEYELNECRDTILIDNSTTTPRAVSAYYQAGHEGIRNIPFTVGQNADGLSGQIEFNTPLAPLMATPQFNVALSGPNGYYRTFQSIQGPGTVALTLSPGNYTLHVEQIGTFEDGYAIVRWTESSGGPTNSIGNFRVGGLRIKSITDYEANETTIARTRRYEYNRQDNPAISSGRISNKPVYSYAYTKHHREIVDFNGAPIDIEAPYYAQNSSSIHPLTGLHGYHIFYTDVREYVTDKSQYGYTDYKYSFVGDLKSYITFPSTPPTSYDWRRGNLLEVTQYRYDSGAQIFRPVKRKRNNYTYRYTPPNYVQNPSESGAHYTPPTQANESHILGVRVVLLKPEALHGLAVAAAQFEISTYKVISSWFYLDQTIEEDFNDLGGVSASKTITYTYGNPQHAQLTHKSIHSSDGSREVEYTSYPSDYSNTTGSIGDMKNNHLLAYPLERVRYREVGTARTILSGSITTYKAGGKGLIDQELSLETAAPVALASFKFSNRATGVLPPSGSAGSYSADTRYRVRLTYDSYDGKGNVLQYTPSDGVPVSYVWGYGGRYPVAEIRNATRAAVLSTGFSQPVLDNAASTEAQK
ncbi:RHS repeat protein, partial [Parapedobacter sp. ISTM3]|uniref:RHS repeat protein n=1 Tax=Parapedobacter sp. ISTM3 TaxID=2800130 RepID=UPI00190471D6